ncbi:MAG: trypsin-like peptidase domain-containing protein [Pontiellaceae bacterium]|nr:trypsin-like peptidase domain-containing protein [Pontiellaceae bacterium]
MNSRGKWILIGFCGLMFGSALISALQRSSETAHPKPPVQDDANYAHRLNDIMADVVDKVKSSVVVIRTEKVRLTIHTDLLGNPWYGERENLMGEGSGVIIDERGFVLTSWHVIEGAMAQRIEVVFNDGSKLPARYVGHDQATDLAVLRIDGGDRTYPAVKPGDSDSLRVGHMVMAIGSPYSLQSSVSMGHVSQKGRHMQILPYEDFLQTDMALNKGNSGGPLVDVDGRLVGINAAILGEGTGIAFAVPSNLAMAVASSLIEKGQHEWPWIGAFFRENQGHVEIENIYVDTPAARAGLRIGDEVLSVNDKTINKQEDVLREIFNHVVGDKIRLTLRRSGGAPFTVDLVLEQFPGRPY